MPGGPLQNRLRALASLLLPLVALGGCGSSTRHGIAARSAPLESILEDEGHLHADPGGTLDTLRRLGVTRVRVFLRWQSLAPAAGASRPPAGFHAGDSTSYPPGTWSVLDQIVTAAHRRGFGLDMTIGGGAPRWALGHGPRNSFDSWKPDPVAFGAFVHAAASRYTGTFRPPGGAEALPRAGFWSIWNEPNYGPELSPQATDHSRIEVSPSLYRGLLDSAWSALMAAGHRHDTILIGETAPRGITVGDSPGNFSGMVPLRFLRALYCVDGELHPLSGAAASARGCPGDAAGRRRFRIAHPALFYASGFAAHLYPQGGQPPDAVTPEEPDYADLASLPRLEHTLDEARSTFGRFSPLPIYNTEFGYQTNPPEKLARTTSPALAARYLNQAEYISWRDPRVRSYDQYLLSDPPRANASGGFATGLLFKDGRPKATFEAFRLPVYLPPTGQRGGKLEVWGCARPVRAVPTGTAVAPVQIQVRSGSRGAFATVASVSISGPGCYFDRQIKALASAQVRLQWRAPDGQALHSRIAVAATG